MKMIQLTMFDWKNSNIETVHGIMTFADWLESERIRISSSPDREADIRKDGTGRLALFVNEVAEINPLRKYDARIKKV